MPKYIIEHVCSDGVTRYMIWSTIVDAPLTFGCSLDDIFRVWRERHGAQGVEVLKQDLAIHGFDSLDTVITCNRAGKNETCLSRQQIIDYYLERRSNPAEPPIGEPLQ